MIWLTCIWEGKVLVHRQKYRKVFELFGEIHPRNLKRVVADPLVDRVVLAAMERLLEVEHPHGRAGVDVVVVEHAVHRHVLPRSHHHLLGDVAHRCAHTNNNILKSLSGNYIDSQSPLA